MGKKQTSHTEGFQSVHVDTLPLRGGISHPRLKCELHWRLPSKENSVKRWGWGWGEPRPLKAKAGSFSIISLVHIWLIQAVGGVF